MTPEQEARYKATMSRRPHLIVRRAGYDENHYMVMALDEFPEWRRYNGPYWKIEWAVWPPRKVRQ